MFLVKGSLLFIFFYDSTKTRETKPKDNPGAMWELLNFTIPLSRLKVGPFLDILIYLWAAGRR